MSAAGLLTMFGSALYSVTKHGALALAEWLSVTYADPGVTVQALRPQGVRTAMQDTAAEAAREPLAPGALEPEEVGDAVVAGLGEGQFLILSHPEVASCYAARAADPDRWLAGMRRLPSTLEHSAGQVGGYPPPTSPAALRQPSISNSQ